uniref:DoxX family protein n=1 Tax=Thalassovita aquimarina TaxID=2785917 RepID=UPI0035655CFB
MTTNYSNADYAATALRVSSGALFLAHGLLKVNVFTIAGTVGYFESLGLPALFAYLTILAELAGGAARILGVATRLVSLALI